ncbi:MAG: fatty acid desaturase, partial [Bdellovibrionales bacterium]|nr:fatty acid desaturase [Bdellovibrionales bacterium]
FFVFYQIALFGVSVANHRYFSHKSFKASPFFEFLLFTTSAIAFQTPAICWAAVHRKHHHHSDKGEDPHSPWFKEGRALNFWEGTWHAHVYWIFSLDTLSIIKKYTQDFYQQDRLIFWHRFHMAIGIVGIILPGFIESFILGELNIENFLRGMFWGGFFRIVLLHNAVFLINSWGCHRGIGYKRNSTGDQSTNNPFLFPFILGEAWHNNHHGSQTSANNAQVPWEIDPHFWILKACEKVGWVSDIKDAHK